MGKNKNDGHNKVTSRKKSNILVKILETISVGSFQFLDFFITILLEIFVYVGYGIFFFLSAIFGGIKRVVKYTVIAPVSSVSKSLDKKFNIREKRQKSVAEVAIKREQKKSAIASKYYKKKDKNLKVNSTLMKQFFTGVPIKVKNYFYKKYNNLAVVKHYKNKKERELEILYIDKSGKDAERSEEKKTYRYLARDSEGKLVRGYFSALSRLDTHSYLLDEGYEVYEITTNWWINLLHGEGRYSKTPMKQKDLIFWLTQLSTYVKSGVPLTDSVKILSQQNKKHNLKKVYDSMIYSLTMGDSFSEAMSSQGKVFPPLLINMVKAAEMMGDLEGTLDEMSGYYQQREDTRKAMISALTYPTLIMVFAFFVVAFILIYIIPKFESIYDQMGVQITGITAFVLNAAKWLELNYFYVVGIIVGFILIFKALYNYIYSFRTAVQFVTMRLPVVGKIIIYNEITLFAKTFASLNKNNILLTDSIELLQKITNNGIYKMIMYDTISNLLKGEKMSLSFKDNWAIPELAYYMIATGESTGELATMLDKVSEYYLGQQKLIAKTLQTFIEPITIVLLAVVVGGIIVAVIVPVFSLYSSMQL